MNDKRFQKKLDKIEKKGERQKAKQELMDKYAMYYPSKRRKVSNIMLVVIITAIIGYTVASFALQYLTGTEISSTLTTAWFSFFGAEIISLMSIKVSKIFKTHQDDDDDSEGDGSNG